MSWVGEGLRALRPKGRNVKAYNQHMLAMSDKLSSLFAIAQNPPFKMDHEFHDNLAKKLADLTPNAKKPELQFARDLDGLLAVLTDNVFIPELKGKSDIPISELGEKLETLLQDRRTQIETLLSEAQRELYLAMADQGTDVLRQFDTEKSKSGGRSSMVK